MIRKCKLTGQEFTPVRSNQLFISPEARIKYHNIKSNRIRKRKAYIDKPLHENYKILTELMKNKDKLSVHKQYLLGRGFNFLVFTNYKNYEGKRYPCIYDYIIQAYDNDTITIMKI